MSTPCQHPLEHGRYCHDTPTTMDPHTGRWFCSQHFPHTYNLWLQKQRAASIGRAARRTPGLFTDPPGTPTGEPLN